MRWINTLLNIPGMALVFLFIMMTASGNAVFSGEKVRIQAIGIPLADHYAGIVAFDRYRTKMKYADYQLLLLPGPDLVRAYFTSESDVDIAFNVCPMVMDMFAQDPNFRWVSLIHRDGNALAVNSLLKSKINLPANKLDRKPDEKTALSFKEFKQEAGEPVVCAIPSPLATHTTVLYKYLKDHNQTMAFRKRADADVFAVVVKPPVSPAFLKKKAARAQPAALEQSLPWPEMAESGGYGSVVWYSKDVMKHTHGHVECVIIAKDKAISEKRDALKEVIFFIHKAGQDIEQARRRGGAELNEIIAIIRKHIPQHPKDAIKESLRSDLNVINYKNLNVDAESKESFREIMNLAFEAGFIKKKIDIEALADESFTTEITVDK